MSSLLFSASQDELGRFLLDPAATLRDLLGTAISVVTGPAAVTGVLLAAVVLALARVLTGVRRRRLGAGARQVTVLTPPEVDPKGAAALWAHLTGQLRPAWRRMVFGQPHLGFEYTVTPEAGVAIRIWVPGQVPPGLVERAVASAWPGAHTRTSHATTDPLPLPGPKVRRMLSGGELRLGRREVLPIRTDYGNGDLVRDLISAADDLTPGQAACVQVLARPVTGRRVRRGTRTRSGTAAWPVPLLREILDLLTPGPVRRSGRTRAAAATQVKDPQAAMQDNTEHRAAADKARGAHWESVIRYAVTVPVPETGDRGAARAFARGRADALAVVFGSCTDHNYYRHRRHRRLGSALARRRLGRGDLLSVPELAAVAHLPHDPAIPGVQRAGARAIAPTPEIPVAGTYAKSLGLSDAPGGRSVAVRVADARHHLHVLGPTGVGKSTLLAQLILDEADQDRGVVVVDPKGDLITDILARLPQRCADRVVLFDADSRSQPPCLNPLDTPADRAGTDLVVDNLATIFHRTFAQWWGPRTDDVLRASLLTLCRQPGVATLTDLPRLLTEPAFRARVTRATADPVLRGFWSSYEELTDSARNQVIGPLLNKLRHFLFRQFVRNALAAGPSTVDLGEVLDQGGICLARIPKGSLGEDTSRLMGSLLVARTWQATTARVGTHPDQRADATLALDEAHNFLNLATPLEDMLAEARGLRLSLVLAHQNLGQLPSDMRAAVSANARNKVIFTASPEDARDLARHTSPWLSEHDLTHLDAYHAAARVLVRGQQAPPFTLTTKPLPPAVPGRAREIRAAARARLATPPPSAPAAEPGPGLATPRTRSASASDPRRS
ncbi:MULTISPECIES: type IV secretory system conjugative DNA transfer family protein [Nocardia]|uniref:Type IV secretory system conjugative DNA transfer family protein n=3 Tax=Nocardia TaxID=1817 RepID=A0A846XJW1_9NOCA|nr:MULTISPECIES: DUF87 domain-containing protein [Nocardia]MBF6456044.1 type IV secretory system conjugative DNA transfer family protein [Nocardia cyriacigeorgica]MBF6553216.1 type IV secretory system conjugative DNA transfer family protein [Nocardia cyriacigeorgica]NKY34873.1 type IV secretory system conjugative DNA transfer family protein [Nocardia speluncae]TLF77700.1 type IV secretory system conjugative DNA transfer family protein [Nocardia cyriacigeorgica]